jgi:P-type E1-E2 ATPase
MYRRSTQEEAAATIRHLQRMGIETYMITGDNHRTAKAIAALVGIDNVMAEVLPRAKAEKVMELRVCALI